MDVQMPVMDGYEATRQLRALPAFVKLPIVALTAGAFKAEQDAALKAGMNGFVSKPFNVEELIATIQQLTHCQPESIATGQQEFELFAQEEPFDDKRFPGIAINKGLKAWADVALYRNFLIKFGNDFADWDKQLIGYYAASDQKPAAKLLHKLKGVAGNLSLVDVARLVAELEAIGAGVDTGEALGRLRAAMQTAFASIALFAAETTAEPVPQPASPPAAVAPKYLPALLEELLGALDTDTPEGAKRILEILGALLAPDTVLQLQTKVDNYDFRGAEVLVRGLAHELKFVLKE